MVKKILLFAIISVLSISQVISQEEPVPKRLQLGLETFSSISGNLSNSAFLGLFLEIDWGIRMNSYIGRRYSSLPTFSILKKGLIGGMLAYEFGLCNIPSAIPVFAGICIDILRDSKIQLSLNSYIYNEYSPSVSIKLNAGW